MSVRSLRGVRPLHIVLLGLALLTVVALRFAGTASVLGPQLTVDAQNVIFTFGDYTPTTYNVINFMVRNTGDADAHNVVLAGTLSGDPSVTPQITAIQSKYLGESFPCDTDGARGTCSYDTVPPGGERIIQLTLSSLPGMLDCRNQFATVTLTASADGAEPVTRTVQLPITCPKTADVAIQDFSLSAPSVARGGTFTANVTFGMTEGPALSRSGTDPWTVVRIPLPDNQLLRLKPAGPFSLFNRKWGVSSGGPGSNSCTPATNGKEIYCIVMRSSGAPPATVQIPFTVAPAAANIASGCGPVTIQATASAFNQFLDPNPADNTASATIEVTGCQQ